MKYCNSCGLKLDEDFPKCPHCGSDEFKHICPNCTEEFIGTYCPGCGTKYNAVPKTCPQCGSIYFTRSCPNCGYNAAKARQTANNLRPRYNRMDYGKYSGMALVFSILGFMGFFPFSIIALSLAVKAKKMGESESAVRSALILSIAGCVVLALCVLGFLVFLLAAGISR